MARAGSVGAGHRLNDECRERKITVGIGNDEGRECKIKANIGTVAGS